MPDDFFKAGIFFGLITGFQPAALGVVSQYFLLGLGSPKILESLKICNIGPIKNRWGKDCKALSGKKCSPVFLITLNRITIKTPRFEIDFSCAEC